MNERIKSLYKSHIMANARDESQVGAFSEATHVLEAYNPMCGDQYTLYLELNGTKVVRAGFEGYGCAISKASTVVLTRNLEGKTLEKIKPLVELFFELVDENSQKSPESLTQDKDLLAFAAAREFPERKQCATLSWGELRQIYES